MRILINTATAVMSVLLISSALSADEKVEAPTGVAVDSKDNIYLISRSEIQVYSPERRFIKKLSMPTTFTKKL